MADLEDQLRSYGRQLKVDVPMYGAAEGSAPRGPDSESPRQSRGSEWFLVAAASAAIVVTVSLLVPAALSGGDLMNRKGSGVAIGFCLVAAACTSNTDGDVSTVAIGQPATSSAAPSSTAVSLPPLPLGGVTMEPGTYSIDRFGTPIQVTVPAGWAGNEFFLRGQDDSFLAVLDVTEVRTDSCDWSESSVAIGPTVDDMVAALVAQKNTVTTDPQPIEVDGFTGTELVISSPRELNVKTTCYGGGRMVWDDEIGGPIDGPIGTPVTVRVLDLNGERAVITSGSYLPMSEKTSAELEAMVDSLQIG